MEGGLRRRSRILSGRGESQSVARFCRDGLQAAREARGARRGEPALLLLSQRLFAFVPAALAAQFRLIFLELKRSLVAGEPLQPAPKRVLGEALLKAIFTDCEIASAPCLDVQRPPFTSRFVLEVFRSHRRISTAAENPKWNDIARGGRCAETGRLAPANFDYQPTDAQIAYHLARFIEDVRGLPADGIVLRQNWLRAYDFTTDRGAAALNDYARNSDPFAKLGKAQISVDVSSVIRASSESFRVAWTQRTYDNGSLSSTERWTAILTVVIEAPRDAERLRKNPLGVYVRAINWSKELGQ
ncbi:conjugal transfer protein TrbF [Bradyrhizobium cytisi]|uniref:conjugal transfer protein TrbF n=1 Tax=Bradyrhizobium cytisi TaxID=515489 RepID=UPI001FE3BC0F|nr:conjugal transfer protein TrbF [Bradyrhizobium cytisi]